MKTRSGFISNSSSSSFVVNLDALRPWQVEAIMDAKHFVKNALKMDEHQIDIDWIDNWVIEVVRRKPSESLRKRFEEFNLNFYDNPLANVIMGNTDMDNFDFRYFLDAIGIEEKDYKFFEDKEKMTDERFDPDWDEYHKKENGNVE